MTEILDNGKLCRIVEDDAVDGELAQLRFLTRRSSCLMYLDGALRRVEIQFGGEHQFTIGRTGISPEEAAKFLNP